MTITVQLISSLCSWQGAVIESQDGERGEDKREKQVMPEHFAFEMSGEVSWRHLIL